ncbi:MAG: putative ArsR family transcriptional regulator [Cognaticolwellia sp.]|jgi:predicted ArsR family transcriptional regulator
MNTALKSESDLIEYYYINQHMSGDQVAAKLGLSQYQVKKHLSEKGLARTRQQATTKAARTMKQKAANIALSAYDMQELRESGPYRHAITIMHELHA